MVTLYTVGHSTREIGEFVNVLKENRIECVIDVRSFPGSRRYPWFGREVLPHVLTQHSIRYEWCPSIGGRRSKGLNPSPNQGWKVAAFRNYADYALNDDFSTDIMQLLSKAYHAPTTIMCAESKWWQCHRRIIADYAVSRGADVIHVGLGAPVHHELSKHALVEDGHIYYPRLGDVSPV